MIICQICKKEFKSFQSLGSHTTQFHKISKEEYYKNYILYLPNFISKCKNCNNSTKFISLIKGYTRCCSIKCSKLFDCKNPEYIKNISVKTKKAMQIPEIRQKFLKQIKKSKSKETLKKMSEKAKIRCTEKWKSHLYTEKRNEKISKSKKYYWKTHPEERKRIMDIWKKRGETSLEIKMYNFLQLNNIKFEKRYELDQKQYDAYLPDYNILLEFDGKFWHKQSLEECTYSFQIFNFYNDRRKDEIAKKYNIPLFRIKEDEPQEKILEYINLKENS